MSSLQNRDISVFKGGLPKITPSSPSIMPVRPKGVFFG